MTIRTTCHFTPVAPKSALPAVIVLYAVLALSTAATAPAQTAAGPPVGTTSRTAADTAGTASQTPIQDTIGTVAPDIMRSIPLGKIIWAVITFLGTLLVFKYATMFLEALAERRANWRLFIKRLIPVFRIAGWTLVTYVIIFSIFRPPIETLIAVTASAGIAVGFASQDILKNIFGGIVILFDRPFQVGDKIQVGAHYGEVVQIGLRSVRIVTPDDSTVSIPNSEIVSQSVSNANNGEFNCQVVAEFYLPADIDIMEVKRTAYRAAAVSQYVYLKKPIAVVVKNEIHQGRSLLKVRLKAYVLDLRYEFPFLSEMTETVMEELLRRGLVTAGQLSFAGR